MIIKWLPLSSPPFYGLSSCTPIQYTELAFFFFKLQCLSLKLPMSEHLNNPLKHRLYIIIFGTHTRAGRLFDLALIISIITSLSILMIDSTLPEGSPWRPITRLMELFFSLIFTSEYLLRLYCSPKPKAYAKSFYGVVDLLAILPIYVALLFPSASFMAMIRLLRVMRIFRVLKLVRYLQDSNILLRSLLMSRRKILIFFSTVAILVTIFGSLIFIIEGPKNGFTSIPQSIYTQLT